MSYTQTDLDKLEAILANGTRSVTFSDGRRQEYESTEAIMKAIEYVRKQVKTDTGRTTMLAKFSKGVDC